MIWDSNLISVVLELIRNLIKSKSIRFFGVSVVDWVFNTAVNRWTQNIRNSEPSHTCTHHTLNWLTAHSSHACCIKVCTSLRHSHYPYCQLAFCQVLINEYCIVLYCIVLYQCTKSRTNNSIWSGPHSVVEMAPRSFLCSPPHGAAFSVAPVRLTIRPYVFPSVRSMPTIFSKWEKPCKLLILRGDTDIALDKSNYVEQIWVLIKVGGQRSRSLRTKT